MEEPQTNQCRAAFLGENESDDEVELEVMNGLPGGSLENINNQIEKSDDRMRRMGGRSGVDHGEGGGWSGVGRMRR